MSPLMERLSLDCEARLKAHKIRGKRADTARLHFFAGVAFALSRQRDATYTAEVEAFNRVSMELGPKVKANKRAR